MRPQTAGDAASLAAGPTRGSTHQLKVTACNPPAQVLSSSQLTGSCSQPRHRGLRPGSEPVAGPGAGQQGREDVRGASSGWPPAQAPRGLWTSSSSQ